MNKLTRRFRQLFTKTSRQSRQRRSNRCLRTEQLEGRQLLAGDLLHNPHMDADVNNDGYVAPNDALAIINELNARESGANREGNSGAAMYYDVNDDGYLSAIDALVTINRLAEGENPAQIVRYQPIALATSFVSSPQFGAFRYVENGNNDSIEIVNPGTTSFLAAGFAAGGKVLISDSGRFVDTGGSVGPDTRITSNGLYTIASVTATTLTVQGNLATTYPANVVDRDNAGNPLAGQEVSDSSAFFFRPVDNVAIGGSFQLAALIEDLRTETSTGSQLADAKKGAFAGFVDVNFDTSVVMANGTTINDLRFHNGFTGAPSGSFSTPGLVDDAGAAVFGGTLGAPIGAREQLLWRTPFKALNASGTATLATKFAPDNAQENINLATLLFGSDVAIPESMIEFQSLTLNVVSDISAVNDGPFSFSEGSTNNSINVLANDAVFNPAGANPTITTPLGTTAITGGQLTFVGSSKTGANYTFTPTAGFNGLTSFTYTISNGAGATASATASISVTPVNDPPVITAPNSLTVTEDQTLNVTGVSVSDPDNNNLTVTLSVSKGVLTAGAQSGASITLTGTPTQVNAGLNGLTYQPNLNVDTADTLAIGATDGIIAAPVTRNVTINVTQVDDPTVLTVPGDQTGFLGSELIFSAANSNAITVTDPDSTLAVTLAVGKGTLTAGANTGASIVLNGSAATITSQLNGLKYSFTDTSPFGTTLDISVAGGTAQQASIGITIAPPTTPFAAGNSFTFAEDSGVQTLDVLANDIRDDNTTLAITGLAFGAQTITPGNSATVTNGTLQGTLALAANGTGVTFTPALNANGNLSFTYTIVQSPTAGDVDAIRTATVSVTITPVNDNPTLVVPGARAVDEDTTLAIPGISVADVDGDNLTVTVGVTRGTLNSVAPIANSGSSLTLTGTAANINTALAGLTYSPNLNVSGSDSLSVTVNDGNGGSAPSQSVAITIDPINDAPTIVVPGPQSFFTDFDNRFTSTPNPLQISDVDAGSSNVQVDLTVASGTLTLTSTTGVTITPNPGGSNGVRLTGSVTNINSALASGVTYRTSTPTPTNTPRELTVTVNDLGNTGGIPGNPNAVSPLTATATVNIEVLDFVPVDIIGRVFIDHNGDGIKTSNEPGIGGVKVFLSGTDFQGNSVNLTAITDSQGNYKFSALRPTGSTPYTITEEQPVFVETSGTNQASFNLDLRGNITLTGGSFNFAEGGFTPEFADVWKFFALSQQDPTDSGILFGIQGGQKWSILDGSNWDAARYSNPRFTPGADLNSGVLTVFDAQAGADRSANVSTQAGTLTYRGNGVDRVYRVIGGSELLGSVSANPEGENQHDATKSGTAFARGVDALFASGGI